VVDFRASSLLVQNPHQAPLKLQAMDCCTWKVLAREDEQGDDMVTTKWFGFSSRDIAISPFHRSFFVLLQLRMETSDGRTWNACCASFVSKAHDEWFDHGDLTGCGRIVVPG
jgi:hypothetical protein